MVNIPASISGATIGTPDSLVKGSQYQGAYYCQQGLTNLNLSINQVQDIYYQGIFLFIMIKDNKVLFMFMALLMAIFFVAKPGDWISRPAGYSTIRLTGKYNTHTGGFDGRVDGSGCGAFHLNPIK